MGGGFADQLLALSYLRVAACSFAGLFGSESRTGTFAAYQTDCRRALAAACRRSLTSPSSFAATSMRSCWVSARSRWLSAPWRRAFSCASISSTVRVRSASWAATLAMSSCVVVAISFYAGRSAAHSLIATASISIKTSSRKSPLISTSVLAGGCSVSTYALRIARSEAISPTSRRK